jgi:ABC-type molybdate transport system substrate-binding protein
MRSMMLAAAAALLLMGPVEAQSQVQPVLVFSSGSARGVVGDLARQAGVEVKAEFGGGGLLRERIEKGEKPDLFVSADMAQPQKLAAAGRTVVPVIAFARNRECVVSRKALGVTPANLADKLLDPKVRIKTSQPVADPSGDYTWAIFDKIDAMRPGAGKTLKAKGEASFDLTAQPAQGQTAQAALFAQDKVDMTIVYCSAAVDRELPALLTSFPVPAALDPHPVYGVAVLDNRPEALRLALYLLSEQGQAIVAKNGLVPLLDGAR